MLKVLEKLPKIVGHIYTILLVLISWVIFAFEDLGQIGSYLSSMFGLNGVNFANPEAIYYLKNYFIIIVIGMICSVPVIKLIKEYKKKSNKKIEKNIVQNRMNNEETYTKVENIENSAEVEEINQKLEKNNTSKRKIAISIITSVGYVAIIILSTASLVNNSFNPFLYFRF